MEDPVSISESGEVDKLDSSGRNPFTQLNREVLVMTVEIGDGRQDTIKIMENDDPEILAQEFARKHDLDHSLQKNLAMLIQQNKAVVEMRAVSSSPDAYKWTDYMGTNSRGTDLPHSDKEQLAHEDPAAHVTRQVSETVFERLYKQSKKKATMPSAPAQSQPKVKSTVNINYGE